MNGIPTPTLDAFLDAVKDIGDKAPVRIKTVSCSRAEVGDSKKGRPLSCYSGGCYRKYAVGLVNAMSRNTIRIECAAVKGAAAIVGVKVEVAVMMGVTEESAVGKREGSSKIPGGIG